MTDITSIPLDKLAAWEGNVRKTAGADTALAELAASIAAHGLINNLVLQPEKKGVHAVVTGGRRLAALQSLAQADRLARRRSGARSVSAAGARFSIRIVSVATCSASAGKINFYGSEPDRSGHRENSKLANRESRRCARCY